MCRYWHLEGASSHRLVGQAMSTRTGDVAILRVNIPRQNTGDRVKPCKRFSLVYRIIRHRFVCSCIFIEPRRTCLNSCIAQFFSTFLKTNRPNFSAIHAPHARSPTRHLSVLIYNEVFAQDEDVQWGGPRTDLKVRPRPTVS